MSIHKPKCLFVIQSKINRKKLGYLYPSSDQYNSNKNDMIKTKRHDFQFDLKIKGVSIKANILKISEDGKTV